MHKTYPLYINILTYAITPLRYSLHYKTHLKRPGFTVARTPLRKQTAFRLNVLFLFLVIIQQKIKRIKYFSKIIVDKYPVGVYIIFSFKIPRQGICNITQNFFCLSEKASINNIYREKFFSLTLMNRRKEFSHVMQM